MAADEHGARRRAPIQDDGLLVQRERRTGIDSERIRNHIRPGGDDDFAGLAIYGDLPQGILDGLGVRRFHVVDRAQGRDAGQERNDTERCESCLLHGFLSVAGMPFPVCGAIMHNRALIATRTGFAGLQPSVLIC